MPQKISGLGRGLGSLIPQKPASAVSDVSSPGVATKPEVSREEWQGALEIPVAAIAANPEQPRTVFGRQELEDLMNSIREHGILQPLVVSKIASGVYELIAGERRYRAAKMLGLEKVPVVIREAEQHNKLLLALIENIQRENLNPLEEARAYTKLSIEFGLTQDQIAKKVGKARPTVANMMRLLDLPEEIQEAIETGAMSAGSARAILALKNDEDRLKFFRKMTGEKKTTRDIEDEIRGDRAPARKSPVLLAMEEEIRDVIGAKVEIKKRGDMGTITFKFFSDEEFEELRTKLTAIRVP